MSVRPARAATGHSPRWPLATRRPREGTGRSGGRTNSAQKANLLGWCAQWSFPPPTELGPRAPEQTQGCHLTSLRQKQLCQKSWGELSLERTPKMVKRSPYLNLCMTTRAKKLHPLKLVNYETNHYSHGAFPLS